MSRPLHVLFALLIAFWGGQTDGGVNRRPPKCCPDGQILNSVLDCTKNSSHQLLVPMEVSRSYPNCLKWNLTAATAEEGKRVQCLDVLLESDVAARDSAKLVGLSCGGADSFADVFQVPRVDSVKKCCPPDRKYTNYSVGCWSSDVPDDVKTVDKLLTALLNETPSYAEIRYGAPICKSDEALVDYSIPYKQVRQLDSEALLMRIPGHREHLVLSPDGVCVDIHGHDDLTIIVRLCQDEKLTCDIQRRTCVRKCCPDGQSMYHNKGKICKQSKESFELQFYSNTNHENFRSADGIYPSITYGQKCKSVYLLEPWNNIYDTHYLDTNGQLYMNLLKDVLDKENYCIEYLSSKALNISRMVSFACFPDQELKSNNFTSSFFIATGAGSLVSCFFLLLTLMVYLCLPNLQNIHGKTVMCYIVSLLAAYICLSINQIGSLLNMLRDEGSCKTVGYATVFTFLAAFSWLHILCFDIWYTFGSARSSFIRRRSKRTCRFLMYNLFCWGFSAIITTIIIATDYAAKYGHLLHTWVSDIGFTKCWFSYQTKGQIIFFIIPVGFQLAINLILFILTIRHCLRVRSEISNMHNNSSAKMRYNADKKKFTMVVKLFVVMGITWGLEILSHFIDPLSGWWGPSDVANALQGIFIFFLFVFKKKIIKDISHRIREILPCCDKDKAKRKGTRSSASTVFTTVSSECKLSSLRKNN